MLLTLTAMPDGKQSGCRHDESRTQNRSWTWTLYSTRSTYLMSLYTQAISHKLSFTKRKRVPDYYQRCSCWRYQICKKSLRLSQYAILVVVVSAATAAVVIICFTLLTLFMKLSKLSNPVLIIIITRKFS